MKQSLTMCALGAGFALWSAVVTPASAGVVVKYPGVWVTESATQEG